MQLTDMAQRRFQALPERQAARQPNVGRGSLDKDIKNPSDWMTGPLQ